MSRYLTMDTSTFPDRTICDVLKEMRALYKTCNFSPMPGLIEELQVLANRMEANLDVNKTYFEVRDEIKKSKKELVEINTKIKKKKK